MSWAFHKVLAYRAPCAEKTAVEIGFGNGEYLVHLGRTNPDVTVIGIEVSQWCVQKAARRVLREGIPNVRLMYGDARLLLSRCFGTSSVDRIIMNFPCPWPKTRHAARRVTSLWFAEMLKKVLKPGGMYELATDVEWYAHGAAEFFASASGFRVVRQEVNPQRELVTKYERKWKEQGLDTHLLEVCLEAGSGAVEQIETEDTDMAAIAENINDPYELASSMCGREISEDGCLCVFRELLRSENGDVLLSVVTVDDGFEQHFYLRLFKSARGVGVKVDSCTHPYRTPSVKSSIRYVTRTPVSCGHFLTDEL